MLAVIVTIVGTLWGFYFYDLIPYLFGALVLELLLVEFFCFKLLSVVEGILKSRKK